MAAYEKPTTIPLAVYWTDKGWKTYQVSGTRHAANLLRKLAQAPGFGGARLNLSIPGLVNILSYSRDDVLGSDSHGKFGCLFDRGNIHYDLTK